MPTFIAEAVINKVKRVAFVQYKYPYRIRYMAHVLISIFQCLSKSQGLFSQYIMNNAADVLPYQYILCRKTLALSLLTSLNHTYNNCNCYFVNFFPLTHIEKTATHYTYARVCV